MELTHVGHTQLMKQVGGAHAPGGGPVTSLRPMGAPMHFPRCSSALGPSLGPIQEPGWQWAANYPESAPEGMTSRILTPPHTQPWEMLRKGDVSGARIPSVVLRSLPCSHAVSEPRMEEGLQIWPQQQGSTNGQVTRSGVWDPVEKG